MNFKIYKINLIYIYRGGVKANFNRSLLLIHSRLQAS